MRPMTILSRLLRPGKIAYAHCDGPCGVYDPASARIAAEAALSMARKLNAMGHDHDLSTENTKTRFILIKEQQAELAKREIEILWTDYFKPEHLEKYPDLGDTILKATKLCSRVKQEAGTEAGEELMSAIEKIHQIFWATKNRNDVAFYRAG